MELGLPVVWQFARVSGGDVALLAVPEVAQAGLRRSRGHGCGFALLAVCLLVQSMWTPATAFRLHHSSSGIGWTAVMFVLAADKARPPDHFSGRPLVSRPGRPVRAGPLRAVRSQGDLFRRALTPGATLLDAENANLRSALEGAVGGKDAGCALRLVNAMAWYWNLRGAPRGSALPRPGPVGRRQRHSRAGGQGNGRADRTEPAGICLRDSSSTLRTGFVSGTVLPGLDEPMLRVRWARGISDKWEHDRFEFVDAAPESVLGFIRAESNPSRNTAVNQRETFTRRFLRCP
ncbi:MAG TPA: hypothetical protein VIU15_26800 [Streptomyces sp.]